MNLIEIYINEVTRRLPEKSRKDIAMELQSLIEDMLPEKPTDEDIKKVLMKLGDPAKLANEYADSPRYLIGPTFFDSYLNVLSVSAIIAFAISFFSSLVNGIFTYDGINIIATIVNVLIKSFGASINSLLHVFFWITVVFAILDRIGVPKAPFPNKNTKWTPDDLLSVKPVPAKRPFSKKEVFFSLFWTVLWASVLFNSSHFMGRFEQVGPGLAGLKLTTPLFNQDVLMTYAPAIIGMIVLEVGIAIYKLFATKRTILFAILNTLAHIGFTVILCVMLQNSELFNPAFIAGMLESSNVDPQHLQITWDRTIWGIASLMIVFSIWDSVRGFIKWNKNSVSIK